jgi:hypothetical protein
MLSLKSYNTTMYQVLFLVFFLPLTNPNSLEVSELLTQSSQVLTLCGWIVQCSRAEVKDDRHLGIPCCGATVLVSQSHVAAPLYCLVACRVSQVRWRVLLVTVPIGPSLSLCCCCSMIVGRRSEAAAASRLVLLVPATVPGATRRASNTADRSRRAPAPPPGTKHSKGTLLCSWKGGLCFSTSEKAPCSPFTDHKLHKGRQMKR